MSLESSKSHASSASAAERLAAFRVQASRHSPVKTRARAKGVLADKTAKLDSRHNVPFTGATASIIGSGNDVGPRSTMACSKDEHAERSLPFSSTLPRPYVPSSHSLAPVKPSLSPQKRDRSPSEEAVATGNPAKRLHAEDSRVAPPLRSPPRSSRKSGALATPFRLNSRGVQGSTEADPFLAAGDEEPPHTSEGRPLLLRSLSLEDKMSVDALNETASRQIQVSAVAAKTPAAIAQAPMEQLSSSRKLIMATSSHLDGNLRPSAGKLATPLVLPVMAPLSGMDAFRTTLGLARSLPLPSSPLRDGLSRRSLVRSRSSPMLNDQLLGANQPVSSLPTERMPSFVQPGLETGIMPTPQRSMNSQGLLDVMASRPSQIPRLLPTPLSPSEARVPSVDSGGREDFTFAGHCSITTDMANRLAGLQSMMSSMGADMAPRRRHSSIEKAPVLPKTPLVGGHHLRRRVSASDAETAREARDFMSHRRASVAPSNRGSLLPLASAGGALAVLEELSPTKKSAEDNAPRPLASVTAFVDVRTAEGDDSSQIFVEMLKSLGARVLVRLSPNATHVVFKGGRSTTLSRVNVWTGQKPYVVAVGWVVSCREAGEQVDETPFLINLKRGPVFQQQKKRRTLEPRHTQPQSRTDSAVERAKQLSRPFAPHVGSPLAKRAMTMSDSTTQSDVLHSEETIDALDEAL